MNPSTPSRGQGTGLYVELNPEELPPSYYDHEGNTLSSSFQNDARAASATMRLLPTGYDSEDMGGGSDLGTNATHFRMGQTSSTRRRYVVDSEDPNDKQTRKSVSISTWNPILKNPLFPKLLLVLFRRTHADAKQ